MTSTLLIGAHSMVGWSVYRAAQGDPERHAPIPVCSTSTRAPACRSWLRVNLDEGAAGLKELASARRVIYCGGICNVGRCEAHPAFARQVNIGGVRSLLAALPDETRLVFCSTDHVFGGVSGPCDETTQPVPISVYGQTRIQAEALVLGRPGSLIVRASLGIGPSLDGRTGHLDWLTSRSARALPMSIVVDEARAAVWASDLGRRIWDLAHSDVVGIRHVASTRIVGRPRLAEFLIASRGLDASLRWVSRADLPYPHLGRVALSTCHRDALARPLRSPLDADPPGAIRGGDRGG